MTTTTTRPPLLRTALAGNALFSLVSGLLVAVLAFPLGDLAGLPGVLLVVVGVGVVAFGVSLAVPLRRGTDLRRLGWTGFAADAAWVAGAAVLIAVPGTMSGGGKGVLGVLTLAVAGFGIAEWIGLRRLDG